jgi:hypothetical protein
MTSTSTPALTRTPLSAWPGPCCWTCTTSVNPPAWKGHRTRGNTPFSGGASWNRTSDLSIISADPAVNVGPCDPTRPSRLRWRATSDGMIQTWTGESRATKPSSVPARRSRRTLPRRAGCPRLPDRLPVTQPRLRALGQTPRKTEEPHLAGGASWNRTSDLSIISAVAFI